MKATATATVAVVTPEPFHRQVVMLPQPHAVIRYAARFRRLVEAVDHNGRSGVITGARIVLWLGTYPNGCGIQDVARALRVDPKFIRRCIHTLVDVGLVQAHDHYPPRHTRPVRVFTLSGGSSVVTAQHRNAGVGGSAPARHSR